VAQIFSRTADTWFRAALVAIPVVGFLALIGIPR